MTSASFLLEPNTIYLNHGAYGATPRVVLEAQTRWRHQMERQPVRFFSEEYPLALDKATSRAAAFVGAIPDNLFYVRNATAGTAAVLHSFPFKSGDRILITEFQYAAVTAAVTHLAKQLGLIVDVIKVPCPLNEPSDVTTHIIDALKRKPRLLIIDHIVSQTAMVFPIHEICEAAHANKCLVHVDGAHTPGNLDLNLEDLGADTWVGNLHKWAGAPKSAAVLWASPQSQSWLHPAIISYEYNQTLRREFAWLGTQDYSAWLASIAGMDHHDELGGPLFRANNRSLARCAKELIVNQTDCLAVTNSELLDCAMATVLLPIPATHWQRVHKEFRSHNIEVYTFPLRDRCGMRISAYSAYNTMDDYHKLTTALKAIVDTYRGPKVR